MCCTVRYLHRHTGSDPGRCRHGWAMGYNRGCAAHCMATSCPAPWLCFVCFACVCVCARGQCGVCGAGSVSAANATACTSCEFPLRPPARVIDGALALCIAVAPLLCCVELCLSIEGSRKTVLLCAQVWLARTLPSPPRPPRACPVPRARWRPSGPPQSASRAGLGRTQMAAPRRAPSGACRSLSLTLLFTQGYRPQAFRCADAAVGPPPPPLWAACV